MKSLTLITTALVLCGSTLTVATAAPPSDVTTAIVKIGDLDATRPEGQKKLFERLTRAAYSVCSSLDPTESGMKLQLGPLHKACIERAVSGAVSQVNQPEFSDYVASRMPTANHIDIRLADR